MKSILFSKILYDVVCKVFQLRCLHACLCVCVCVKEQIVITQNERKYMYEFKLKHESTFVN